LFDGAEAGCHEPVEHEKERVPAGSGDRGARQRDGQQRHEPGQPEDEGREQEHTDERLRSPIGPGIDGPGR